MAIRSLAITLLAMPILILVYISAGLAYILNRIAGEQHCVAGPSAPIGASLSSWRWPQPSACSASTRGLRLPLSSTC